VSSVIQSDLVSSPLPGYRAYTTPRGLRIVEIDYWANPSHDGKWAAEQRPLHATNKDWRREMERDWSSPAGEPYFPVFSQIGREMYEHLQKQFVDQWPIFRSYDFGRRRPAAVWFQYSPSQDRVIAYREFMPRDLQTHEFRDAVRFLSGQLEEKDLKSDFARQAIDQYAARPSGAHCPPPWFPPGTMFMDFTGHEAMQGQANAPKREEAVVADIFAAGDIHLNIRYFQVLGRNRIIDRLLLVKEDGWPGVLIDPQMEESLEGFDGAWAYPEKTKAVPVPTKPRDDGHFINLLDAWGYGIASVVPEDTPKPPPPRRLVGWQHGRTPIYTQPEREEVLFHETRRRP
jgi:hypothetical protein